MANTSIYAAFERMWQHIVAKLGSKVDQVEGKDLSSNDYTDDDKAKVAGVEVGANKTVIDTLLTETGAAAEAKAVGDALQDKVSVSVLNSRIPECSTSNDGQFLRVVNGSATWSTVPNAEEAEF